MSVSSVFSILFCFSGESIFHLPKALIIIRITFFNLIDWRMDSDVKWRSLKKLGIGVADCLDNPSKALLSTNCILSFVESL